LASFNSAANEYAREAPVISMQFLWRLQQRQRQRSILDYLDGGTSRLVSPCTKPDRGTGAEEAMRGAVDRLIDL
jgi:hypothetical protein